MATDKAPDELAKAGDDNLDAGLAAFQEGIDLLGAASLAFEGDTENAEMAKKVIETRIRTEDMLRRMREDLKILRS